MTARTESGLRLVLASASPRRSQLLREAGFAFDVRPADLDEEAIGAGLAPSDLPTGLANAKARVVAARHAGEPVVVLAADTVVYASGEVLGKPRDAEDARRMMRLLSGSLHSVATGYCAIRCTDGETHVSKVRSDVLMRPLTSHEIDQFINSGEWEGKAGGYGIQDTPGRAIGSGDPFIEQIMGELTNIVGLPMPQVIDVLERYGVVRDSGL